jgi:hypothetical protein
MLQSLLPRAHHKFLSMPLLGQIGDGFDDWLASNGYTRGSRKFTLRMLLHVDADLRRRRVRDVASLTPAMLDDCWRALIKVFLANAGTVRALKRYLTAAGLIVIVESETKATSSAAILSQEYVDPLREVRGFATSTLSHHRYAAHCFLNHLKTKKISRSVRSNPKISRRMPLYGLITGCVGFVSPLDWCGRGDLNPHAFRRHPLKMVCLPVPPLPQFVKCL